MTAPYYIAPRVGEGDKLSVALGASAGAKFSDNDLNKAVKLAANNNYVLVSAGDAIEGSTISMEPFTVNNGFSFGTIQTGGKMIVTIVAAGTTVVVGDQVVAAAQAALGTAQDYPIVRKIAAETPAIRWRVVSLWKAGTGVAGTQVVIERL